MIISWSNDIEILAHYNASFKEYEIKALEGSKRERKNVFDDFHS